MYVCMYVCMFAYACIFVHVYIRMLGWGDNPIFRDKVPRVMDSRVFRCADSSGGVGF